MFDVATVRVRGPLVGLLPALVEFLAGQGYRDNSVRFLAVVFARLSGWLGDEGVEPAMLDWPLMERFVAWSKSLGHRQPGSRRGVAPLVRFLVASGVVPAGGFVAAVPVEGSAEDVARLFVDYLSEFRGITASTAELYGPFALTFLGSVAGSGRVEWARVDAVSVQGFLAGWSAPRSVGSAETMASVLRALLRFAFVQGWTEEDMSGRVGKVASRRLTGLVEGLPAADVDRLIGSIDAGTPIGARDKAVVVVLARLGLRAGEVARLGLDDFNWAAGMVRVRDPKGRRDLTVPLPGDVGAVLVGYLRARQAPAGQRVLFLRERAPVGPLTATGVSGIVAARASAAGLGLVHAHRLRHAAAMAVIASGGTLVEAGQLLGHARAATTLIYAKTDTASLRGLALEWPEVRGE